MRTSETGTRSVPEACGFTLLELLIVIALVGLVISLVRLSFAAAVGADPERRLRDVAERIALAHEETAFSGALRGLRLAHHRADRQDARLEFDTLMLADGAREARWEPLTDSDRVFEPVELGTEFEVELLVDGAPAHADDARPQVLLLPDGDLSAFRLTLRARSGGRQATLVGDADGDLHVERP